MTSLAPAYLSALAFNSADASVLKTLGEYRGRQDLFKRQTPQILRALRDEAVIESSESSNRIEGVVAPHDRIEALVLHNSVPGNRSEQEIAGYRDALNLIHGSAREMTFSVNVILQLHTLLYRYHSGRGGHWKATNNEIVERDASGAVQRVRFVPPAPIQVPALMETLTANYQDAATQQREPLILIPLAILDFLSIHPFTDGNGRTARLLMLHAPLPGRF